MRRFHRPYFSGGATLIEVLVSLLIISGGLLGMAAVQGVSLRGNQAALYRTWAVMLGTDIIERMRANSSGVAAGFYDGANGSATAACFTPAGCSSEQMAAQDLLDWRARAAMLLPAGAATVCIDSTADSGTPEAWACDGVGRVYAAKVWWDEDRDGVAEQRHVMTWRPW